MILRLKGFQLEVDINEGEATVLTISNKFLFRSIVQILQTPNEDDNTIVIENNNQILNIFKETFVLCDYINIEFRSKMILTQLYRSIESTINLDSNIKDEIDSEIKNLGRLIYDISNDFEFDISYNCELNIMNLLKFFDVQLDIDSYSKVIDKLYLFFDLYSRFNLKKLIIFINLKAYFTFGEIKELYKYLFYKKILFICIESEEYDRMESETNYLIDEDLVEFKPFK